MPGRTSYPTHLVASYTSPSVLPKAVWLAFKEHQQASNIMYPHALKLLAKEQISPAASSTNCWITLSTKASVDAEAQLELVLSCTSWALGDYPIFIFTPLPFSVLSLSWLHARMERLTAELIRLIPVERVYSVFAPAPVTKAFTRVWQSISGAVPIQEPYYAALLSFCTRHTFRTRKQSISPGTTYIVRRAEERDLLQAAKLCKGFAETSDPFILDDKRALREAMELTSNNMLWVHEIQHDGTRGIASIVATTRESEDVTAITKVYTNPLYRSQGCAERLVRRVVQDLLWIEGKKSVVLFVAHDNHAAATVYDRVGFVGLCNKPRVEGVEPWVETGFHNTNLGHW